MRAALMLIAVAVFAVTFEAFVETPSDGRSEPVQLAQTGPLPTSILNPRLGDPVPPGGRLGANRGAALDQVPGGATAPNTGTVDPTDPGGRLGPRTGDHLGAPPAGAIPNPATGAVPPAGSAPGVVAPPVGAAPPPVAGAVPPPAGANVGPPPRR